MTREERKRLAREHPEDFVIRPSPENPLGGYPIPDVGHAINAEARARQFGSPSLQRKVHRAVERRFPKYCTISGCSRSPVHSHGGNACCGAPLHCAQVLGMEQQSHQPAFGPTSGDYLMGVP